MGAVMMMNPELTAECCAAIRAGISSATSVDPEVSVKCRIGVNDYDKYDFLSQFIETVSRKGAVKSFQVHARKALLDVSTINNRDIPPLNYEMVYQLVEEFPGVEFEINGGIDSPSRALEQFRRCPGLAGVMVGRACINHPYMWCGIDQLLYSESAKSAVSPTIQPVGASTDSPRRPLSRGEIIEQYAQYCEYVTEQQINCPHRQQSMTSVLLAPAYNLFTGEKACEQFRRGMKKMVSGGVTSAARILRTAARGLPEEALHGRVGQFEEMDSVMKVFEKSTRSNAPMRSRIF
jgi:tRNA-dihydrouridine synthase